MTGAAPVIVPRSGSLALARRLDWRFLLSDPALGRVLLAGRPDDALVAAVEAFAEEVVRNELDQADLVVAHAPTASELRAAADRVGPGGWIVIELVERWRPGRKNATLTAGSIEALGQRLRQDGFVDVATYWAWPDHAGCLEIVPLDEPALVRLSLARRRASRRARLKALGAGILFRIGLEAVIVPSVTIVARRAGPIVDPSGMLGRPAIDAFVSANRVRLGVAGLGMGRLASLLLTPRFQASAHVVGLVAPVDSGRPAVVVKLQRLAGPARSLATEAGVLRAVTELGPAGGARGPRLLSDEPIAGHAALAETALDWRPLDPPEVRRDRPDAIRRVGAWVRGLRRADPPADPDDRWSRLLEPALERLERALADDPADSTRVARARELAGPLRTTVLPLAIEHGDLGHPNLVRLADGPEPRIGAIDWELGEPAGWPLGDFLFFLGYVAVATAGRQRDRGAIPAEEQAGLVVGAFGGPDPWAAGAAVRQAVAEGIDPALLGPLLVATWTRALASVGARLDTAPDEAAALLRGHRYHAIWRRVVDGAATIDWSTRD